MIHADKSEVDDLARDLFKTAATARERVLPTMHRGGNNMVRTARELAPSKRLPHYGRTITYDVEAIPGGVAVEVGPDREINGQAKLGHLWEYGSPSTSPRPHLNPALDAEIPNLEEHLGDVLGRIVR